MRRILAFLTMCAVVLFCWFPAMPGYAAVQTVTIKQSGDRLGVLIDGELFTEYIFRGHSRPFLFPIIGPHGLGMTRSFPIKMGVPGESHDHPHQKPMFFAYGWVNGVNFFAESPECGTTVHDKLLKVESGSERGLIRTANNWIASDGKIVCTDTRTLCFQAVPGGRAIDWEITVHASHGDVMFRDDKHGILAIRTHPNLRLDNAPESGVTAANGQAVNSEGVHGKAVFGKGPSGCVFRPFRTWWFDNPGRRGACPGLICGCPFGTKTGGFLPSGWRLVNCRRPEVSIDVYARNLGRIILCPNGA